MAASASAGQSTAGRSRRQGQQPPLSSPAPHWPAIASITQGIGHPQPQRKAEVLAQAADRSTGRLKGADAGDPVPAVAGWAVSMATPAAHRLAEGGQLQASSRLAVVGRENGSSRL